MTEATQAQSTNPQLATTIDIKKLTLEDWLSIAGARENSEAWGIYGWLENSEAISELTLEDMKAIATRLEKTTSWVMKKIEAQLG